MNRTQKSKQEKAPETSYKDVVQIQALQDAYRELIRQTRKTFDMYCFGVITCALVTAGSGYTFLNTGHAAKGAVAGTAGTSAVCFAKLAKESREEAERRLSQITHHIKKIS